MKNKFSRTQLVILMAAWVVGLVITGWSPKERMTWILEVFPVLIAMPVLWFTFARFPFPRYIYIWIFLHGVVLMIGGHYTYAEVPIGFWVRDALGLARNHYDRLGHLMQGFVPALIAREILVRRNVVRGTAWLFFLVVTICASISVFYELVEWWAALLLGESTESFLGTQGDPWDTQTDMFLAIVGAVIALLVYRKRMPRC